MLPGIACPEGEPSRARVDSTQPSLEHSRQLGGMIPVLQACPGALPSPCLTAGGDSLPPPCAPGQTAPALLQARAPTRAGTRFAAGYAIPACQLSPFLAIPASQLSLVSLSCLSPVLPSQCPSSVQSCHPGIPAQSYLLPGWCTGASPTLPGGLCRTPLLPAQSRRVFLRKRCADLLHHLLRPTSGSTITQSIQTSPPSCSARLAPQHPGSTRRRGLARCQDVLCRHFSQGFRPALRQQSSENNCTFSVYTHFCFQLFSSASSAGGLYAPHYQAIASPF